MYKSGPRSPLLLLKTLDSHNLFMDDLLGVPRLANNGLPCMWCRNLRLWVGWARGSVTLTPSLVEATARNRPVDQAPMSVQAHCSSRITWLWLCNYIPWLPPTQPTHTHILYYRSWWPCLFLDRSESFYHTSLCASCSSHQYSHVPYPHLSHVYHWPSYAHLSFKIQFSCFFEVAASLHAYIYICGPVIYFIYIYIYIYIHAACPSLLAAQYWPTKTRDDNQLWPDREPTYIDAYVLTCVHLRWYLDILFERPVGVFVRFTMIR